MISVIATICARGGSRGVPRKNARPLLGKPLIAHTVEQAIRCSIINAGVYVSTDDDEIAAIAEAAGATIPFRRPAELATDEAGKIPVLLHLRDHLLAEGHEFDAIVDLDPTCPLRSDADIEGCFAALTDDLDVVFSCCESRKNPYFNMVEAGADGYYGLSKPMPDGPVRRQDAPRVFEINGAVYAWHRDSLDKGLWDGKASIFEMPADRSVDIDSETDYKMVESLMIGQRREHG